MSESKRSCVLSLLLLVLFSTDLKAADFSSKMVGGTPTDLQSTAMALITTDTYICSGVLVAPDLVLTAAHCASEYNASKYIVVLGNYQHTVSNVYQNIYYNDGDEPFFSAPYDLGMIRLSYAFPLIEPLPILKNDLVVQGELLTLYGYGTNEVSDAPNLDWAANGRRGQMVVTDASMGLLMSEHSTGGVSTCPGDSGGPAVQTINGYTGVVGILSIGVNTSSGLRCSLVDNGFFAYADLQSSFSQGFLARFSEIRYLSGGNIYVQAQVSKLITRAVKAGKLKKLASLVKDVKKQRSSVAGLLKYAEGAVYPSLRALDKKLAAVQKAKSFSAAQKAYKKALTSMKAVRALGVYAG